MTNLKEWEENLEENWEVHEKRYRKIADAIEKTGKENSIIELLSQRLEKIYESINKIDAQIENLPSKQSISLRNHKKNMQKAAEETLTSLENLVSAEEASSKKESLVVFTTTTPDTTETELAGDDSLKSTPKDLLETYNEVFY